MNTADRLATGATLVALGIAALAVGVPYASAAVGLGLGFLISGYLRWKGKLPWAR